MNPDFSISNLDPTENIFVREQLKLIIAVTEFLQVKESRLRANRLLLRDVYTMTALSRARDAKVLNAILTHGRSKEESQELEKAGLLQRLFGDRNKDG